MESLARISDRYEDLQLPDLKKGDRLPNKQGSQYIVICRKFVQTEIPLGRKNLIARHGSDSILKIPISSAAGNLPSC
jgi:hypothetical protein